MAEATLQAKLLQHLSSAGHQAAGSSSVHGAVRIAEWVPDAIAIESGNIHFTPKKVTYRHTTYTRLDYILACIQC